jgi:hypothetical protein
VLDIQGTDLDLGLDFGRELFWPKAFGLTGDVGVVSACICLLVLPIKRVQQVALAGQLAMA